MYIHRLVHTDTNTYVYMHRHTYVQTHIRTKTRTYVPGGQGVYTVGGLQYPPMTHASPRGEDETDPARHMYPGSHRVQENDPGENGVHV